jgi:hypothetical protein
MHAHAHKHLKTRMPARMQGMSCRQFQALPPELRSVEDAALLRLAGSLKWKRCPAQGCGIVVERTGARARARFSARPACVAGGRSVLMQGAGHRRRRARTPLRPPTLLPQRAATT